MATVEILLQVFIIFVAAKLAGELASRLGVPPIIGELLAGIAIGPHALGLVGRPGPALLGLTHDVETAQEVLATTLDLLAELGVVILLFAVGLETRMADVLRVGGRATAVAMGGIVLPLALGYGLGVAAGESTLTALFIGTALVATSVGITARVLGDLGKLRIKAARIILGAAVIDDILGMIILAIVVGLASGGPLSAISIGAIVVEAIAFTVFVGLVGTRVIRQYSTHLGALRLRNAPFVVALGICLALATLAGFIGLAAIIGAFLAGMVFAEAREREVLEHQTRPLYDFLVPFFFVVTGTHVDPALLLEPSIVWLAIGLIVLAVVGKLVGCGLAALGLGRRTAAIIGVGMVPRGEVGLVVAGLGQSAGAIPDTVFSVVVIMSVVTTLIAPPVLGLLLSQPDHPGEEPDGLPIVEPVPLDAEMSSPRR